MLTPHERELRARQGGYARAAHHDVRELAAKSTATFLMRLEREVDPLGLLSPTERMRRVQAARRAYYTSIALRSAIVRRKNAKRSALHAERSEEGATSLVAPTTG